MMLLICRALSDAVSLHYYRNVINLQGLIEAVDTLWNLYHKPIWITEMSLFGRKGTEYDFSYENEEKRAEIQKYLEGAMEALDANPHVKGIKQSVQNSSSFATVSINGENLKKLEEALIKFFNNEETSMNTGKIFEDLMQ